MEVIVKIHVLVLLSAFSALTLEAANKRPREEDPTESTEESDLKKQESSSAVSPDGDTAEEKNACAICLDFMDREKGITSLPCPHSFHTTCIETWFMINKTCPTCRRGEKPDTAIPDEHSPVILLPLPDEIAAINHEDFFGFSCLHDASMLGCPEIAGLLIASGANVNAVSNRGITPLMLAAENGSREVVQILLNAPGINLILTNSDGQTATDVAQTEEIRALIQSHIEQQSVFLAASAPGTSE